ncbi:hypothetical protein CO116_01305, partial [Candidatus Falkowbacteria bacterium CG_4_9_14_3_um_filter_38_19]
SFRASEPGIKTLSVQLDTKCLLLTKFEKIISKAYFAKGLMKLLRTGKTVFHGVNAKILS